MDVSLDHKRHRHPALAAIESHLHLGQRKRIEHEIDLTARELGVNLVGVAVHGDRSRLGNGPPLRPTERFGQRHLTRPDRHPRDEEPFQWCLPGLCVNAPVVDLLNPALKDPVEILKARGRAVLEFDQQLLTNRAKDTFDLPASLRPARRGMDQLNPEHGAGSQQLPGHKRAAVVNVDRLRQATGGDPRAQRPGGVQDVLACGPPVTDQQTAVIVNKAEQERAGTVDQRAVQRVPGPQLIRSFSFEATERPRDRAALPR